MGVWTEPSKSWLIFLGWFEPMIKLRAENKLEFLQAAELSLHLHSVNQRGRQMVKKLEALNQSQGAGVARALGVIFAGELCEAGSS